MLPQSTAFNRAASAPDSAASSAAQRGVHRASVDLSAARSPSSAIPNSNPAFAIPDASAAHDGSGDSESNFTFSSVPSATPGSVQSGASVGHGAPAHSPLTPPTGPSGLLQHSPVSLHLLLEHCACRRLMGRFVLVCTSQIGTCIKSDQNKQFVDMAPVLSNA